MYITPMGAEAEEPRPRCLRWSSEEMAWQQRLWRLLPGPTRNRPVRVLFGVLADDWDTSQDIAKVGKAAVPGLLQLLKDPEAKAKHHLVIKTLGLLSAKARDEVVPPLIESLASPEANVRQAAANALATIQPVVAEAARGFAAADGSQSESSPGRRRRVASQ